MSRRKKSSLLKPSLSAGEMHQLAIYNELMEQYRLLGIDRGVPMMAVRLYVQRLGGDLSVLLRLLAKYGVAMVAERCRHEMALRQQFFADMVAKCVPDDPEQARLALLEAQPAIEEMAEDLAILDCPEGGVRLLAYLDRILTREQTLKLGNGTVH